ncbi:sulfurtransferase [Reinekea blandensis]|uniref:Probable 3-mercaptopyruvate sulfurtransferase n=1 Tax=Reinekea blandensis MED297 TaxID=314283 RepID=A4BGT3_9GAMM|nr:sulfurtransferase [Reinekea blandensis]EAR08731.1 probable 3-mercaptopyruvate sulfurtransferase [Reinekea sp. MED297] [Reinekea blandensis MED297]
MSQLISPAELKNLQRTHQPIILDCRSDLTDKALSRQWFREGHIPGAQQAHLEEDLSGPIIPGQTGRHPLPDPEVFSETLRRWGVTHETPVIVYDQGNGMFAARAWWMMKWVGLNDVRVLNGGLKRWLDEGGELTQAETTRAPSDDHFEPDMNRVVDADRLLSETGSHRLLDARALTRYRGDEEPLDSKAGHIPGADNADFTRNLQADGAFLEKNALFNRFASLANHDVICYCGSGVTACHNILAITEAGLPMPKLYPGSWSEWITNSNHPIATGEEGVI